MFRDTSEEKFSLTNKRWGRGGRKHSYDFNNAGRYSELSLQLKERSYSSEFSYPDLPNYVLQ